MLLSHNHEFVADTSTLHSRSNGGLFSNLYHTVWSLVDLWNVGVTPEEIDFSGGFFLFKNEHHANLYPLLFERDTAMIVKFGHLDLGGRRMPRLDHHGVYALYPFELFEAMLRAYFRPSRLVLDRARTLEAKYGIDVSNTVGVYYRGTDKHTEVSLASPDLYLRSINEMGGGRGLRVFVQTDQAQVRDVLSSQVRDSFFLEELPVSAGSTGIHFDSTVVGTNDREEFAVNLLAAVTLLSRCRFLVLCSSNMAGWICLARGNPVGVTQFNKHGRRIGPAYRAAFRLKNVIRRLLAMARKQPFHYV